MQLRADDLNGLKEIMTTRTEHFCLDALQEGMKKCQEWNIEINRRTRRRKMPGEMAADAGHTAVDETKE